MERQQTVGATYHPSIHSDDPTTMTASVLQPRIRRYQIYLQAFTPKVLIALSSDLENFLTADLDIQSTKVRKILAGVDTKYFRPPN